MESSAVTLRDIRDVEDLMECGMQDEAEAKLMTLATLIEKNNVFSSVGSLTRDLHDAISNFVEDDRMKVIASKEMPDASERLQYIITMTEKAASKTLDAVDSCDPLVKSLIGTIEDLMPAWDQLMHRQIDRYEFVNLCHKIDNLIIKTRSHADEVSEQLNRIMMAQDYQDLTGQMIHKVIKLVAEVEDRLLKFLLAFNADKNATAETVRQDAQAKAEPQGPALEKDKQEQTAAASQDEVDDLLASLGF